MLFLVGQVRSIYTVPLLYILCLRLGEAARAGGAPGGPGGSGSSAPGGPSSDPLRNPNLSIYEYYQRISYEQIITLHRAQAAAAAGKDPAAAAAEQARMAEYARLAQHFASKQSNHFKISTVYCFQNIFK